MNFQTLIAFFQALPQIVELTNRLLSYFQKNDINSWLNDLEKRMDQLEAAQTSQEKLDATRGIVRSIQSLND